VFNKSHVVWSTSNKWLTTRRSGFHHNDVVIVGDVFGFAALYLLKRLGLLQVLHTSSVDLAFELFFSFAAEVLPLMIGSSRPFTMTMSSSSIGYGSGTAMEGASAGLRSARVVRESMVLPLVLPFVDNFLSSVLLLTPINFAALSFNSGW
jgi:hypothetical protein